MFYYLSPRSGENFDLFMPKNGSECRKKHVLVIFHEKIGEKNLCATHKRPKIFYVLLEKFMGITKKPWYRQVTTCSHKKLSFSKTFIHKNSQYHIHFNVTRFSFHQNYQINQLLHQLQFYHTFCYELIKQLKTIGVQHS